MANEENRGAFGPDAFLDFGVGKRLPARRAMRESKIEDYLRREIAKLGGWCEKHASPGTRGVPDNIVMWPANHWNGFHQQSNFGTIHTSRSQPFTEFIETKAPGGKPTVLQAKDHARRRAMGFTVHVIATMEAAEEYLRSRGKK